MENPLITIYGYGYVGRAVFKFFKDHYNVQVYDPIVKDDVVQNNFKKLLLTPYAIICVPTNSKADKSCDMSIVENTVKKTKHKYYLIKSTIVPGTTAKLIKATGKKIAFSPEYIGEGKYEIPF